MLLPGHTSEDVVCSCSIEVTTGASELEAASALTDAGNVIVEGSSVDCAVTALPTHHVVATFVAVTGLPTHVTLAPVPGAFVNSPEPLSPELALVVTTA